MSARYGDIPFMLGGFGEDDASSTEGLSAEHPNAATNSDEHIDNTAPREPQQNRLSAYSFTNLPEVVPAATYQAPEVAPYHGKEVHSNDHKELVPNPENEKERAHYENFPEPIDEEGGKEIIPSAAGPANQEVAGKGRLNRRVCGVRLKWALLGLALLILLIIALGAGLGAGLQSSSGASSAVAYGGALDGTKIVLVTTTFTSDEGGTEENLVMYFQHQTGQIRWMRLASNGSWIGGDTSTVIADDAKMNTPISAISYIWNGASFRRVYYVDYTNNVKEIWAGSTQPNQWTLGLLGDDITPLDDDHVGLLACWYGPTYGNEYLEGYAQTSDSRTLLIRLMYAKDETTFQEMSFNGETQVWSTGETVSNLNGHATPACNNWEQGSVDYLMAVDLHNTVNIYWKDTGTGGANSTSHPLNQWTNSSVSIPYVEDSASLGFTKYLYAQDMNDFTIKGHSIVFNAENTTLGSSSDFVVQGKPGLPNTGVDTIAQPGVGGDNVLVFYQTNGTYVSEYKRGLDGGQWSSTNIQIPLT